MDTAPNDTDEKMLPKEPVDLPREPIDLPTPELSLPKEPEELPAHITSTETNHDEHMPPKREVKTLLSWTAPGRPFRPRSKQFYFSVLLILMLVEVILFLFSEYMLMLVSASLAFVTIALATVPPHDLHYRISSEGITIEDTSYLWMELYDFYFKKRHGHDVLHVQTKAFIPGELTITLGQLHTDQVKAILLHYLPYREVIKPTFIEKSGNWLSKNFPLEKVSEQQ